jgi:hypothetical protein
MRVRLEGLSMIEHRFEDVTDELLPGLKDRIRQVIDVGAPILGVQLLSTSDLRSILDGMLRSTLAGRIAFVRGVYERGF